VCVWVCVRYLCTYVFMCDSMFIEWFEGVCMACFCVMFC